MNLQKLALAFFCICLTNIPVKAQFAFYLKLDAAFMSKPVHNKVHFENVPFRSGFGFMASYKINRHRVILENHLVSGSRETSGITYSTGGACLFLKYGYTIYSSGNNNIEINIGAGLYEATYAASKTETINNNNQIAPTNNFHITTGNYRHGYYTAGINYLFALGWLRPFVGLHADASMFQPPQDIPLPFQQFAIRFNFGFTIYGKRN